MEETKITIDVSKEELLMTLGETQAELEALKEARKKELAEELSKLTGKKAEEYLQFSEDSLKEMIKLVEDNRPKKSKGVVESKEPKLEEKDDIVLTERDGGEISFTEEAWERDVNDLRKTTWMQGIRYIPKSKEAIGVKEVR